MNEFLQRYEIGTCYLVDDDGKRFPAVALDLGDGNRFLRPTDARMLAQELWINAKAFDEATLKE